MTHEQHVAATRKWLDSSRFAGILRLYSAGEVAEQQGTIASDHTVAREAAEAFHGRLRELFAQRRSITTFGPYSPGQAVTMKRIGIEGIYLGGWATSAKGSLAEDPGPDLASYPLGQVPDEAASLVRALLTADKNQHFDRLRMTEEQRAATPIVDYRPFIIADADTGHGGDAHVRNLIRRFVEVGVPGYHIEDQRPGAKKCGHQAGKVLVSQDEQIKRLNAARLQLDVMGVAGLIVARTDAEAATFLDNRSDERDQPFILGATSTDLPSYKAGYLGIMRKLADAGVESSRGHLLFAVSEVEYRAAFDWFDRVGLSAAITETAQKIVGSPRDVVEAALGQLDARYMEIWQAAAGLKTYAQAVADVLASCAADGQQFEMTAEAYLPFARGVSFFEAADRANTMGISVTWDCELPKTPEGFYQIQGGIDYAIAKSLGVAPFADLLWMETKTGGSRGRSDVCPGDSRAVPGEDAGVQLVAVVQLGYDRDERRRDEAVSRGTGEAWVRLQLHHLRWTSDRWPRGRGIRDGVEGRRDAGAGAAPAQVPAPPVAVPDPRRRWSVVRGSMER